MLRCLLKNHFLLVQVRKKCPFSKCHRNDAICFVVLPGPEYILCCVCECFRIVPLLLWLSGDIKENPGPDTLDEILKGVMEIQTSQRTLEEGLHGVQSRLTEIEVTLASPKQYREKLEQVTAMSKDIKSPSKKIDMENRSRRNNIIIYGLEEESDESSKDLDQAVVNGVFKDKL